MCVVCTLGYVRPGCKSLPPNFLTMTPLFFRNLFFSLFSCGNNLDSNQFLYLSVLNFAHLPSTFALVLNIRAHLLNFSFNFSVQLLVQLPLQRHAHQTSKKMIQRIAFGTADRAARSQPTRKPSGTPCIVPYH